MNNMTITTGKVRFSYAHLFTPAKGPNSDVEKYSLSVIIPKSDTQTLVRIKNAIEATKEYGVTTRWGGKLPTKPKLPLHDGDEDRPDDPAYANSYYFNCSSKNQPGIVDANLNPILDQTEVYSGCYGRVNVSFYPYDAKGTKGIAVALNSVQKLADGTPLGGKAPSVEEAFGSSIDDLLD